MNETLSSIPLTVMVARMGLAALLAGIIGWERERLRKPAGFRTHILVGVGSALAMLVSLYMADLYPDRTGIDPGRIAAQVVVGIGFLGAGTILRSREGIVTGLTTAASLWVVSGIGLAAGCGLSQGAVAATALVMVVLFFMNRVDEYIEMNLYHSVTVHAKVGGHLIEEVKEVLRSNGVRIVRTEAQFPSPSEKYFVVHFKPVAVAQGRGLARLLSRIPGVKEVVFD